MVILSMLDRYIARHLLVAIALTLLVLTGLSFIGLFMGNVGDVGTLDYSYGTLFAYILLNLPAQLYEMLPAAALVGTSAGLSLLALSSELTAMRAAGVSLYRIFLSAIKLCLLLVVLAIVMGEWMVPAGLNYAEQLRSAALHQPLRDRIGDVWLRENKEFVRIGEVMPDHSLEAIDIVEPLEGDEGMRQIEAKRAVYQKDYWLLQGVRQTRIVNGQIHTEKLAQLEWRPRFSPELMGTMQVPQQKMSTLELFRYVRHLKQNHQDAASYELTLWKKLITPFSTLIMVTLAVPFVFGSIRTGGLGRRVFVGVMLGFMFSLMQTGMGYYSLSFGIAPSIAAIAPSIVFLALTVFLFYRAVRVS